jgi:O-antigen/teichoic acid export membrane protein
VITLPYQNWSTILNAPKLMDKELRFLAIIVVGTFCLRFVISIVNTLLTADQEPGISIFTGFIGNLLSLVLVFLVTKLIPSSLLSIGIALSLSQVLPSIFSFFYLFRTRYRNLIPSFEHFSKKQIKNIFSLGIRFFAIQITALMLFQTNNIIIAHVCGLNEVTEFNIAFKYTNIVYIAFSGLVAPLWSASTEAFIKGEISWIQNAIKRLNQIWIFLMIVGVVIILLSPLFYKLWLKDSIQPNYFLLFMLLFYFACVTRSMMYRSFMNGVGKISLQFYVTLLQSILHIPLAFFLGQIWGFYGIISVMILWAFLNAIWEPIQFKRIIFKTAVGVWNR